MATSRPCAAPASAPNDLLDQRDQLIKQIGNLVKVSTVQADDGTMGVFIAGGQRLVLGAEAQQLAVTPDPANTARSMISISDSGITHELSTDLLVGGSISGLMKYQNEDLVSARNQLGQMAAAVSARVNQVQAASASTWARPPAPATRSSPSAARSRSPTCTTRATPPAASRPASR